MVSQPKECSAWAEAAVIGTVVRDLFAADCILLVSEGQRRCRDRIFIHVIQRGVRGVVGFTVDSEGDVAEAKRRGPRFTGGEEVFRGAKEPVEGRHDEVDGSTVGLSVDGVLGVQDVVEVLDDGDIGGVGPGRRIVFFFDSSEEIRE